MIILPNPKQLCIKYCSYNWIKICRVRSQLFKDQMYSEEISQF